MYLIKNHEIFQGEKNLSKKNNYFEGWYFKNTNNENVNISGKIDYSDNKNIKTSNLNPNIMGPFSYMPFMECNHAIVSMQNKAKR